MFHNTNYDKVARKEPFGMQQYIDGDSWRCPQSPTGAHWWKELKFGSHKFTCKHCHAVRMIGKPLDITVSDEVLYHTRHDKVRSDPVTNTTTEINQ